MTFYLKAFFRYYSLSSWRKTWQGGDIEWNTDSEQNLMTECKAISGNGNRPRILFVGFSGHGKTTSISNFCSVFLKGLTYTGGCYDVIDCETHFGVRTTKKEKEIPIKTSEELTCFSFIDSPGMAEDEDQSMPIEYVKSIITGSELIDKLKDKKAKLKPCSLVFVMDATKVTRVSRTSRKTIGDILKHAEKEGVAVEILLTKCDLVDTWLQDPSNIRYIFFSPTMRKCVKYASRYFLGIPENRIHPIVNNTTNTTQMTDQKILHLLAMRSILANAKSVLESRPPNGIDLEHAILRYDAAYRKTGHTLIN